VGPLPKARLAISKPISKCGVDFCGPIHTYLRLREKAPSKSYLVMFVCLVVKAVHIEEEIFTDIYCDNGTNFVGASNQLHDLIKFLFN